MIQKPGKVSISTGRIDYRPYYDKLFAEFSPLELEEEQLIPFDELSAVIQLPVDHGNFSGIVRGWINRLEKDYHVYAKKVDEGVLIMTNDQIYDKAEKKFKSGLRSIVKAGTIARDVKVDSLSSDKRERCLLLRRQARMRLQPRLCKKTNRVCAEFVRGTYHKTDLFAAIAAEQWARQC